MISKKELRSELIIQRKTMSDNEVITKSSLICNKILNSKCYKESSVVYCYFAVNNEVNLNLLITHALNNGKIIALPKVEGKDIKFYEIKSFEDLKPGYYNIPEPVTDIEAPKADLIIVPGVAFSKEGARLGYGGGFYDRFLADNQIYSIGVGYDFQLKDNVPTEEFDRILNEIVIN